jgi:hypothetical protein
VAAAVVPVAVTGTAAGEEPAATTDPAAGSLSLGVLRAPPTARRLPAELLRSFAAPVFALPIGVPVGELDGYAFYFIIGRGDNVCLMGLRGSGASAQDFGACGSRELLRKNVIWVSRRAGRSSDVAGILPDGYSKVDSGAASATVANNVFLMRVRSGTRRVEATGEGVRLRTISLRGRAAKRR